MYPDKTRNFANSNVLVFPREKLKLAIRNMYFVSRDELRLGLGNKESISDLRLIRLAFVFSLKFLTEVTQICVRD